MRRIIFTITAILLTVGLLIIPPIAEAGLLFHATKRAAARKIMQKGFSTRLMRAETRFGRGVYTASSKSLALKEKPKAETVVVLRGARSLQKYSLDTRKLSKEQLKRMTGDLDLRGNLRRGTIGPDLGRKIGTKTGKSGNVIIYRSARSKHGFNVFIPKEVYKKHPTIVQPKRMITVGK
jgi:hypothetical protein